MNRLAVMFLQNLQKYLKEHFWSKKKEKSNARKMLEQGSIILHFYSPSSDHSDILPDSDVDVDSDTDKGRASAQSSDDKCPFAHLGFVNFKTWSLVLHRLSERQACPKKPNKGRRYLQSYALNQSYLEDPGCRDVCMTDLNFFKSSIDFSLAYFVTTYSILQSQEKLESTEMLLGFVDVSEVTAVPSKLFWEGRAVELLKAASASKPKHRPPGPNPNQPKKTQRKKPCKNHGDGPGGIGDGQAIEEPEFFSNEQNMDSSDEKPGGSGPGDNGNGDDDGPVVESDLSGSGTENESDAHSDRDDENVGSDGCGCYANAQDIDHSTDSEDDLGLSSHVEVGDLQAVRSFDFDSLFEPGEPDTREPQAQAMETHASPESPEHESKKSHGSRCSGSSSDSSDSSDSGSSSDSSSSHSRVAVPRALPVTEFAMDIPGYGFLRYNSAFKFLRAHCTCEGHGKVCYRRRSSEQNAKRPGQGRPIGLLIAWLKNSARYSSHSEHVKASVASLEERSEARVWFKSLPHAEQFEKFERALRPVETLEPHRIL